PAHAVIAWHPVTTPAGVDIVGYEVVIEQDAVHFFDVKVPGTATSVTVPPEMLQPHTQYTFEVLAIDKTGNQTITSASFVTRWQAGRGGRSSWAAGWLQPPGRHVTVVDRAIGKPHRHRVADTHHLGSAAVQRVVQPVRRNAVRADHDVVDRSER